MKERKRNYSLEYGVTSTEFPKKNLSVLETLRKELEESVSPEQMKYCRQCEQATRSLVIAECGLAVGRELEKVKSPKKFIEAIRRAFEEMGKRS